MIEPLHIWNSYVIIVLLLPVFQVSTDNTYHLRLSESIKSLQSALNVQEHDMTPVEILSGGYTMPESPCPKGAQ